MSPEMFLDIFQEALKTIVIMVAFIIVPGKFFTAPISHSCGYWPWWAFSDRDGDGLHHRDV